MPTVIGGGGVFNELAWQPALRKASIPFGCTRVFASGANDLVLVGERWLVHPTGARSWGVRKWQGWRDPEFDAAATDEALDSRISLFVQELKRHAVLWRFARLIVPLVILIGRTLMRTFGDDAMQQLFAVLARLLH
jgi:hypothetical protein